MGARRGRPPRRHPESGRVADRLVEPARRSVTLLSRCSRLQWMPSRAFSPLDLPRPVAWRRGCGGSLRGSCRSVADPIASRARPRNASQACSSPAAAVGASTCPPRQRSAGSWHAHQLANDLFSAAPRNRLAWARANSRHLQRVLGATTVPEASRAANGGSQSRESRLKRQQKQRLAGISRAGATGLEPATSGVTGRRSNQLNYAPRAGALYRRSTTGSAAGSRARRSGGSPPDWGPPGAGRRGRIRRPRTRRSSPGSGRCRARRESPRPRRPV